jgi:hypothetical protein
VHELSHAYINVLRENATMPEVAKVLQDIEKSFGIEGGNWDARPPDGRRIIKVLIGHFGSIFLTLEDYIQTGQAPNDELTGIFDRIIQWQKEVFRDLSRRTEVSRKYRILRPLFSAEEKPLYQYIERKPD